MNLLNNNSPISIHPKNVDIILKNHQLAMLKRCIDIENISDNKFGIMNDKPGTGKTYVILSLIYETKASEKTNIIVVPHNIYSQWIFSIEKFSKNLSYKKFIEYDNIMQLYIKPDILKKNDIILTTSSYYHIIATTLSSLNININRIFFDEIDSISNIICTNINSNFIWFISASFNINYLGYFKNKLEDIDNITCKCDDEFINENIYLDLPIKKYYLCKNLYVDNILNNVISKKELKGLNAMDYTLYNKEFENSKAQNEKEVIEIIIRNRKSIIIFDKCQIKDAEEKIKFFEDYRDNKLKYELEFKNNIEKIYLLQDLKENVIIFLEKFNEYTDFYLNEINLNNKNDEKLIKESHQEDIKNLKINLQDTLEIYYNFKDDKIEDICNNFYIEKIKNATVDNLLFNLKNLLIIIKSLYKIILKISNDEKINFNDNIINFNNKVENTKDFINNLINTIINYDNTIICFNQINIQNKILEICNKNILENENKINLIYKRLEENNCCPICYEEFKKNNIKKIYITNNCCNNKVCEDCIKKWYNMKKTSCIFCNTEKINLESLLFYINNEDIVKDDDFEDDYIVKDDHIVKDDDIEIKEENNIIRVNENKYDLLKNYIIELKNIEKKIIIFSDFPHIFDKIEEICNIYEIGYVDLDKGNIKDIDKSVNEYKFGNAKILLSNSTLFGCGMNFENSTDIIFVHKMEESIEKQVIGRAQRMGRKSVLNIIYLEYENENTFFEKKILTDFIENDNKNDELTGYYNEQQYHTLLENIQHLNFLNNSDSDLSINIATNEIFELDNLSSNISNIEDLPDYTEHVDINLDELISSLF